MVIEHTLLCPSDERPGADSAELKSLDVSFKEHKASINRELKQLQARVDKLHSSSGGRPGRGGAGPD